MIRPHGRLGAYLYSMLDEFLTKQPEMVARYVAPETWVVWDEAVVAYALGMARGKDVPRPKLQSDLNFQHPPTSRRITWLTEIETDKATVEVESSASGVVRKLLVDQGAVVPIGAAIAIVGGKDEPISDQAADASKTAKPSAPPAKSATPVQEPKEMKQPSEMPATTPSTGPAAAPPPVAHPAEPAGPAKASPLAKRMARDANLDLSRLQGSGPGGRITRKDVEAAMAAGARPAQAVPQAAAFPPPPVAAPVSREDQLITPTRLRQIIARRMAESKSTVPHFYVTHEYKMDALMELRKQVNSYLPDDQKISVNDFIVKAVALTLREFPNLNSSYAGQNVIRRGAVNVGVAVATVKQHLYRARARLKEILLQEASYATVGQFREECPGPTVSGRRPA